MTTTAALATLAPVERPATCRGRMAVVTLRGGGLRVYADNGAADQEALEASARWIGYRDAHGVWRHFAPLAGHTRDVLILPAEAAWMDHALRTGLIRLVLPSHRQPPPGADAAARVPVDVVAWCRLDARLRQELRQFGLAKEPGLVALNVSGAWGGERGAAERATFLVERLAAAGLTLRDGVWA